jgi:hypothetical protein
MNDESKTLSNYEAALSRYEQARYGLKCASNDMLHFHLKKLAFHLRGVWRAFFNI